MKRTSTDEGLPTRVAEAALPLEHGPFRAVGYRDPVDRREHLALVLGSVAGADRALVRVHSECRTGDVFRSRDCACGSRLELALRMIAASGCGALVYLRGQDDWGIGGGHAADDRDARSGAGILADLGVTGIRLLGDDPRVACAVESAGIAVRERLPLITVPPLRISDTFRKRGRSLTSSLTPSLRSSTR